MKLLLTSGGVTNASIRAELDRQLGKPVSACHALAIPTAQWGHPLCGPGSARRFVAAGSDRDMTGLGWASVGLLELTALPSIPAERWTSWIRDADALLVDGGDATYLAHWMRESGLADLLPTLDDTVWVGISAGSMAMTPRIGHDFVEWAGAADDATLGIVDFAIYPHLDVFPSNTVAHAERWVEDVGLPAYVIDDETAIAIGDDGISRVISEGRWLELRPGQHRTAPHR